MQRYRVAWVVFASFLMMGASGCFTLKRHGELPTASYVDMQRIMGTWYVQGAMTTLLDNNPSDATFTFFEERRGPVRVEYSFVPETAKDGEAKIYTASIDTGKSETNADWKIQFLWPFKNDYRVIYLSDRYDTMIIGHPTRKYLYILSRQKELDYASMEWLLDFAASRGYDTSYLKRIPHS